MGEAARKAKAREADEQTPKMPDERCECGEFHPATLRAQLAQAIDLIRWLAPRIERVPGSGIGVSRTLCLLCVMGKPEFKRLPCRHSEIWKIAEEQA